MAKRKECTLEPYYMGLFENCMNHRADQLLTPRIQEAKYSIWSDGLSPCWTGQRGGDSAGDFYTIPGFDKLNKCVEDTVENLYDHEYAGPDDLVVIYFDEEFAATDVVIFKKEYPHILSYDIFNDMLDSGILKCYKKMN